MVTSSSWHQVHPTDAGSSFLHSGMLNTSKSKRWHCFNKLACKQAQAGALVGAKARASRKRDEKVTFLASFHQAPFRRIAFLSKASKLLSGNGQRC